MRAAVASWVTTTAASDDPSSDSEDERSGDVERDMSWQAGRVAAEMYPEGSSQIDTITADRQLAVGETTFANNYRFGDGFITETGRFGSSAQRSDVQSRRAKPPGPTGASCSPRGNY